MIRLGSSWVNIPFPKGSFNSDFDSACRFVRQNSSIALRKAAMVFVRAPIFWGAKHGLAPQDSYNLVYTWFIPPIPQYPGIMVDISSIDLLSFVNMRSEPTYKREHRRHHRCSFFRGMSVLFPSNEMGNVFSGHEGPMIGYPFQFRLGYLVNMEIACTTSKWPTDCMNL